MYLALFATVITPADADATGSKLHCCLFFQDV